MTDSYQAVFDAVRSRISNGNVGDAVRDVAFHAFDISHEKAMIRDQLISWCLELTRPCVLFRPTVSMDGNMWCALYGADLMEGVAGFGRSPAEAMEDFDKNWKSQDAHKIKTEEAQERRRADSQFGVGA